MKAAFIFVTCILGLVAGQAWVPQHRTDEGWWNQHNNFVANTNLNSGNIKLLFYGDSITAGWNRPIYDAEFGQYGNANYAIGGDQTQHLIFRILNGEVTNIEANVMVLKIGTNNLGGHSDEDIARGIKVIMESLWGYMPNTKVLLLGVLPRNGLANWNRIKNINSIISEFETEFSGSVYFFDMWDAFVQGSPAEGTVDPAIFPDGLHLSVAGYQLWADTMRNKLSEVWDLPAPSKKTLN